MSTGTIFKVFPLALPEPLECKLQRLGVEPWMITPDIAAFNEVTTADPLKAFSLIDEVVRYPDVREHKGVFNLLWQMRVTPFYKSHRGDIDYMSSVERGWDLLNRRHASLACWIVRDAIKQREEKAWRAKCARELKKARAA